MRTLEASAADSTSTLLQPSYTEPAQQTAYIIPFNCVDSLGLAELSNLKYLTSRSSTCTTKLIDYFHKGQDPEDVLSVEHKLFILVENMPGHDASRYFTLSLAERRFLRAAFGKCLQYVPYIDAPRRRRTIYSDLSLALRQTTLSLLVHGLLYASYVFSQQKNFVITFNPLVAGCRSDAIAYSPYSLQGR